MPVFHTSSGNTDNLFHDILSQYLKEITQRASIRLVETDGYEDYMRRVYNHSGYHKEQLLVREGKALLLVGIYGTASKRDNDGYVMAPSYAGAGNLDTMVARSQDKLSALNTEEGEKEDMYKPLSWIINVRTADGACDEFKGGPFDIDIIEKAFDKITDRILIEIEKNKLPN